MLITPVLKADTPHNQIASESVVPQRSPLLFYKHTFPPGPDAFTRQPETLQSVELSVASLLDRYFGRALSPSMHCKHSDSQSPHSQRAQQRTNSLERPCTIFYSTLCCSHLDKVTKMKMQGKAQGAISWSQKSFEIFFLSLDGAVVISHLYRPACTSPLGWPACPSFAQSWTGCV